MGRVAKGWWDGRSGRYLVRLGPESPTTGKPSAVPLLDPDGLPVRKGDLAGRRAAIERLSLARESRDASGGPTVAEVCRDYVAWQAERGAARATVKTHHYHLSRFATLVGEDRGAAGVGPEDLWKAKARGMGALRLLYASVLACWRWAERPVEGRTPVRLLKANPFAGLAKPPRGQVTDKLIGWETTRKFLRAARAWARLDVARTRKDRTRAQRRLKVLCLTLIAHTGARPFEACGLRWDEVDWEHGMLVVGPTRAKRRGRARRIALPPGLARALKLVHAWDQRHPTYVFAAAWSRAEAGIGVRELGRWFRDELKPWAAARGASLPPGCTLYWFRHDYQSTGLEAESIEGVAAAAGNSPAVLQSTYAHHRSKRISEVAGRIARKRRG